MVLSFNAQFLLCFVGLQGILGVQVGKWGWGRSEVEDGLLELFAVFVLLVRFQVSLREGFCWAI